MKDDSWKSLSLRQRRDVLRMAAQGQTGVWGIAAFLEIDRETVNALLEAADEGRVTIPTDAEIEADDRLDRAVDKLVGAVRIDARRLLHPLIEELVKNAENALMGLPVQVSGAGARQLMMAAMAHHLAQMARDLAGAPRPAMTTRSPSPG